MIQEKSFDLGEYEGGFNNIKFEIGENRNNIDFHFSADREDVLEDENISGTVGWIDKETLEELISLIDRFLASKSNSDLSKEFDGLMYMESKSLHQGRNWIKKGNLKIGIGARNNQNLLQLNMTPYSKQQGFNYTITLGDENQVLRGLRQLLGDFIQTPLNIEKPNSINNNLSEAQSRLEISIEKFHLEDYKGAVGEARESFHAIKKKETWLKQELEEKKIDDMMRSRKSVISFGLHCVDRDEKLKADDVEIVLKDVSNLLNYLNKQID